MLGLGLRPQNATLGLGDYGLGLGCGLSLVSSHFPLTDVVKLLLSIAYLIVINYRGYLITL